MNSEKDSGDQTASGKRWNDRALVMAHKTYALNGFMRLTNRRTGKVISLQVIDRGPYIAGRCADISPEAAKELGIDGLGPVKVEAEYGK